jgi:hypothetical protein
VRSQRFADERGDETVWRLSPQEAAEKRALFALYRSERGNLKHIESEIESFRPLPAHDYARAPHAGTLFRERFHWVPFRHPRIDFEPRREIHRAFAAFRG